MANGNRNDLLAQLLGGGTSDFNFNPSSRSTGLGGSRGGGGGRRTAQRDFAGEIRQSISGIGEFLGALAAKKKAEKKEAELTERQRRLDRLKLAADLGGRELSAFLGSSERGRGLQSSALQDLTSQAAKDERAQDEFVRKQNERPRKKKKQGPPQPTSGEEFDAELALAIEDFGVQVANAPPDAKSLRDQKEKVIERVGLLFDSQNPQSVAAGRFFSENGALLGLMNQNETAGRNTFAGLDEVPPEFRAAYFTAIKEVEKDPGSVNLNRLLKTEVMNTEEFRALSVQEQLDTVFAFGIAHHDKTAEQKDATLAATRMATRKADVERQKIIVDGIVQFRGGDLSPEQQRVLNGELFSLKREVALIENLKTKHQAVLDATNPQEKEVAFRVLMDSVQAFDIANVATSKTRANVMKLFIPDSTTIEDISATDGLIDMLNVEGQGLQGSIKEVSISLRAAGLPSLEELIEFGGFSPAFLRILTNNRGLANDINRRDPSQTFDPTRPGGAPGSVTPTIPIPGGTTAAPSSPGFRQTPVGSATGGATGGSVRSPIVDPGFSAGQGPLRFDRDAELAKQGLDLATIQILADAAGMSIDDYLEAFYGFPRTGQNPAVPNLPANP